MPSRPTREEKIQADLDELLGQLAVLAKALLIRNGEFFPFGATIGKRGKYTLVTPVPEAERPTAHDVVDAILVEIQSSKDTLRACGVAAMAETAAGGDAVRIELEHAEGSSLIIALPYARGEFGAFAYGDMEARRAERRIWLAPAASRTKKNKPSARATKVNAAQGELWVETKPPPAHKATPPRASRPPRKALRTQPV